MSATSRRRWVQVIVSLTALIAWTGSLSAQLPLPPSTQFDMTGFLQAATLNSVADPHSGGTLQVNGHRIVVPRETIVILPANALSWQELFAQAPPPYGIAGTATGAPMTGIAIGDQPRPMTTYEVQVVGNRVVGGSAGCPAAVSPVNDCYIAGLIYVAQQGLNAGAGYINWIDYTTGEMRVGGNIADSASGTRVRLNDPVGRYGRSNTPDARFTVDPDNPTIKSETGFPMCLPRTDPVVADDPLCPQGNRPAGQIAIQMNDPRALPGVYPDATKQAPFEIGDYITFAGTMVNDNVLAPTAGPYPAGGASSTYISAHTITNNIAIYTWPGTNPAYVSTDVTILGTGGLTVIGAGEATIRTRFEGMTTDPSRNIHLYGLDVSAIDGSVTDRDWGYVGVDPGPAAGAVKGRWRFRPPCLAFGSLPTKPDKQCVMNAAGTFLPAPREVRAVIDNDPTNAAVPRGWVAGQTATYANGIIAGQYHAPILEYIFPENIPGTPIVENNFEEIPFLAQGGYTSTAGTMGAGRLNPWPGNPAFAPAPLPPPPPVLAVAISALNTVNAGGSIAVAGSVSGGVAPYSAVWTSQTNPATGLKNGTFASVSSISTTWTVNANVAAGTKDVLTLTVTDAAGSTVAATSPITIGSGLAPVIIGISTTRPAFPPGYQNQAVSVLSGSTRNQVYVTTYTADQKAGGKLSVAWTNAAALGLVNGANVGVTLTATTQNTSVTCSSNAVLPQLPKPGCVSTTLFEYTAPTLPIGTIVTPQVFSARFVATNTNQTPNLASGTQLVSFTVRPLVDTVTINTTLYRVGKERLSITATSSVDSPNVILTLRPYVTSTGAIYNPDPAAGGVGNTFTYAGAGLPQTLDLVGAPEPATAGNILVVTSILGGVSPAAPLQSIR